MKCWLPVLMGLACLASPVIAGEPVEFSGEVVSIADGDTLTILSEQTSHVVRLSLIDAPEKGQAFSQVAKQNLARLAFRKVVDARCAPKTDRYARLLCEVFVDGISVNRQQVRNGMAWVYRDYVPPHALEDMVSMESAAQADRRGLWQLPNPTPPWVYRQQRREASEERGD